MTSYLTELALRAAVVNNPNNDLLSNTDRPKEIKTAAVQRAKEFLSGSTTGFSLDQINAQSLAIGLAVQGLEATFFAVKEAIANVEGKRVIYDKESKTGFASATIHTHVEEGALSKEERVIKNFLNLSNKNPLFENYLGIYTAKINNNKETNFYSTFPFYKMSDVIVPRLVSSCSLDKERTIIHLFFKSALPEALSAIDTSFQSNNKVIEFFKSSWKKDNYLNDLRAPRFIMMSLANLLWNLLHPVDPQTGYALGLDACIQLCTDAEIFLNTLLNKEEYSSLFEIDNEQNHLLSIVRKIEMHLKGLKAAYIEKQLYELNFEDLNNSAHRTLRTMDRCVFELIYMRTNPLTGKSLPDSKAADDAAYSISYLNQLINYNSELLKPFESLAADLKGVPYLNSPPTTVIDVLIIFIHSATNKKKELFKKIAEGKNDSVGEFINALKLFYVKFVRPIKHYTRKDPKLNELDIEGTSNKVAYLTACRLLPLLTLVVEDYRINVDIKAHVTKEGASHFYSGNEQVQGINLLAKQNKYYKWMISPFIELDIETENTLDQLPIHQYRFTKVTQLLDSLNEIVKNYKHFLQIKRFQEFLIKCINKVKEEHIQLEKHISEVDRSFSKDKIMSRKMETILKVMTNNLSTNLNAFSLAIRHFEHTVSAPEFTEQQKKILSSALESINKQYLDLFNEDLELPVLFNNVAVDSDDPEKQKSGSAETNNSKKAENPVVRSSLASVQLALSLQPVSNSKKLSPKIGINVTSAFETRNEFDLFLLSPKLRADSEKEINKGQVLALKNIIMQCHAALSFQSKYSEKGRLLLNLVSLIEKSPNFSPTMLNNAIMELARITLSYRQTYFFQAAYAETRSGKLLITALKDKQLNTILPLSKLLCGKDVDCSQLTEPQIITHLRSLRKANSWHESVDQIKPMFIL